MNRELREYKFKFYAPKEKYGFAYVDPKKLDVLWFYGFYMNSDMLASQFKEANPKLKVVATWVGTDILQLAELTRFRPKCKNCITKDINVYVADGQNLVEELDQLLGVKATYIPSIPVKPLKLKPLPKKFAVAAYVPSFRADFFDYPTIREVAERMLDVPFHLFGAGGEFKPDLPNVQHHGWVEGEEKQKWWEKTSVLIYIPKHGSCGVTLIEFLQLGRWAIDRRPYPHVFKCESTDEIVSVLTDLKDKKEGNVEGSRYYSAEYSPQKQAERVKRVLDRL